MYFIAFIKVFYHINTDTCYILAYVFYASYYIFTGSGGSVEKLLPCDWEVGSSSPAWTGIVKSSVVIAPSLELVI
jgi:hypothetical protein